MATQNERHVGEWVEASMVEMMQIQGGAVLLENASLTELSVSEATRSADGDNRVDAADYLVWR